MGLGGVKEDVQCVYIITEKMQSKYSNHEDLFKSASRDVGVYELISVLFCTHERLSLRKVLTRIRVRPVRTSLATKSDHNCGQWKMHDLVSEAAIGPSLLVPRGWVGRVATPFLLKSTAENPESYCNLQILKYCKGALKP